MTATWSASRTSYTQVNISVKSCILSLFWLLFLKVSILWDQNTKFPKHVEKFLFK